MRIRKDILSYFIESVLQIKKNAVGFHLIIWVKCPRRFLVPLIYLSLFGGYSEFFVFFVSFVLILIILILILILVFVLILVLVLVFVLILLVLVLIVLITIHFNYTPFFRKFFRVLLLFYFLRVRIYYLTFYRVIYAFLFYTVYFFNAQKNFGSLSSA